MILEDILRGIVADTCGVDATSISATTLLRDDLGADSFDLLEIAIQAEDALGVDVSTADDDVDLLRSFDDLIRLFARRLEARQGGAAA